MKKTDSSSIAKTMTDIITDMKVKGIFTPEVQRRLAETGRMARRSGRRLRDALLKVKENPEAHGFVS